MSESKRRGTFEERKAQSLLRLANALTGETVDLDRIQITDAGEFAKLTQMMFRQLDTTETLEGRAQDNGSLNLHLVQGTRVCSTETIPAGKWRRLSQQQYDEIAMEIHARDRRDPDAAHDLVERLADAIQAQQAHRETMTHLTGQIRSAVSVAARTSAGAPIAQHWVDAKVCTEQEIDDWLASTDDFLVSYATPAKTTRRLFRAATFDDLIGPVLQRLVDHAGSIEATLLGEAGLSSDQQKAFLVAWKGHGGVAADQLHANLERLAVSEFAEADHVVFVFDDSSQGRQGLHHFMQTAPPEWRDALGRILGQINDNQATHFVFIGSIGLSGGATIGVDSFEHLLTHALPAAFHRLHQKGYGRCAFAQMIDPAAQSAVTAKIEELGPTRSPDGEYQMSPALAAFVARHNQEQLLEPQFGGVSIAGDEIVLSAEWRTRMVAAFAEVASEWAASGNRYLAIKATNPYAEQLADGTLRRYFIDPDENVVSFDIPHGHWTTRADQARQLAGKSAWPTLAETARALHGGRYVRNGEYLTQNSSAGKRLRVVLQECISDWVLSGADELRAMAAVDREPFIAEAMADGTLRTTFYFPNHEFRVVDVPAADWKAATPRECAEVAEESEVATRPILAKYGPDLSVFYVHRDLIESGELGLPLRALAAATASRAAAQNHRLRVAIEVGGYDDDPRELWEVPEVVAYFRGLFDAWPFWYYFLTPAPAALMLFLSLVCDREPSSADITVFRSPDEVLLAFGKLESGLQQLFEEWNLEQEDPECVLVLDALAKSLFELSTLFGGQPTPAAN